MIRIPNSVLTLDFPSCDALAIRFLSASSLSTYSHLRPCSFSKTVLICDKDTGSKTAFTHLPHNFLGFLHRLKRRKEKGGRGGRDE